MVAVQAAPGLAAGGSGGGSGGRPASGGWVLASSSPKAVAAAPPYIGDGLIGTRVPAAGAGFVSAPVATETHAAGVWADVRDLQHHDRQPQGAVDLPGWTTLRFSDGAHTYRLDQGTVESYRQALDLRSGTVTTAVSWKAPDGRVTDLRYQVLLDRAHPRAGAVRLVIRPHWSGTARVTDVLGEGFGYHPDWISSGLRRGSESVSPKQGTATLTVHTHGTGIDVVYADQLAAPAGATVTGSTAPHLTRLVASFPVRRGDTYATTKTVGFATSQDSRDPAAAARSSATRSAAEGFAGLRAESHAAWSRLWRSRIDVPGRPRMQADTRAAEFYLMASLARPGQPGAGWSLSPVGLSSDGYNDHVFWDAETWMYPAVLALHPDLARSVVDYRYRTRSGARANAHSTGHRGLQFAWESALTGRDVTPGWAETGRLEEHITADVALAQWQYYEATGNRAWLASRGLQILRGAAAFWASRATRGAAGRWHIDHVEGPDEYHYPVSDSVYTNVAARTTLRLAAKAARVVGKTTPPRWARIANGLVVLKPRRMGGQPAVRPEFRGYHGDQVKQADTVMLSYPWSTVQPRRVDLSDLRYYAQRYDPNGPAMTDSINSVVWSAQRPPGCANWTWTKRSLDPFATPPYSQFTEVRTGQGVFTFLTGEGGYLQELVYGYPGLRWNGNGLSLDPTLPPQLAGGITVHGVHWHGRTLDVRLGRRTSTVSLAAGAPMTLDVRGRAYPLATGSPVNVRTARPDLRRNGDLALCRPTRATSADPSYPAVGAVDGEKVTGWMPRGHDGRLVVRLGHRTRTRRGTLTWTGKGQGAFRLQVRRGRGGPWHTVGRGTVSGPAAEHFAWTPRPTDAVRVVLHATKPGLQLGELRVGRR